MTQVQQGNITLDGDLTGTSNTNFFVKNDSGEEDLFQECPATSFSSRQTAPIVRTSTAAATSSHTLTTPTTSVTAGMFDDIFATNGTIQTSDQRDKTSITDLDLGLNFINDLRPVSFIWNDRGGYTGTREHMGFIAQEVASTLGDQASTVRCGSTRPQVGQHGRRY